MSYNNDNEFENENLTDNDNLTKIENSPVDENNTSEDTENNYVSQFGELAEFDDSGEDTAVDEPIQNTQKKRKSMSTKKFIVVTVISAVLILCLALGTYFVFFNKTVFGKWVQTQTSEDGSQTINTYYVFRGNSIEISSADQYTYQKNIFNDVQYDKDTFSILQDGKVYMRCSYTVEGNFIQGKKLSYAMEASDALEGPEFKLNDKILGVWKNADVTDYVEYLIFDETGKMTQFSADNSAMRETVCKYNFDGEQLVLRNNGEDLKRDVTIEKDTLSIKTESLYVGEITLQYQKISSEEFEKIKTELAQGICEIPTSPELSTEEVTSSSSTENTATEISTENNTEIAS